MSEERIVFLKEEETDPIESDYPQGFPADDHCCWDILIVDDDPDVHDATVFALKGLLVFDRELRFHHAYSAKEALSVIAQNPGIALILLDAVMETEDAGLAIVKAIRHQCKTKSELTRTKPMTSVIAALRSWTQIRRIGKSRRGLEKIVEASNELLQEQGLQRFADGVITQMAGLFDLEPEGIVCAMDPGTGWASSDAQPGSECCITPPRPYCRYINKIGRTAEQGNISRSSPAEKQANIIGERSLTVFFGEASGTAFATWIASPVPLKDLDTHLLEVFCSNISICANNIALVNRLKEQAWIDPGLQMPNLPALVEKMKTILAQEGERPLTLCILDIDGFNQINEILGHEYGDEILRALVARSRSSCLRKRSPRIASDVFALMAVSSLEEDHENSPPASQPELRKQSWKDSFRHAGGFGNRSAKSAKGRRADKQLQACRKRPDKLDQEKIHPRRNPARGASHHSAMLKRTRHALHTDINPSIELDSFPGVLGQIITNLITNALAHAWDEGEKGTISYRRIPTRQGCASMFQTTAREWTKKLHGT